MNISEIIKKIAKQGKKHNVESFNVMYDEGELIMIAEFGGYKEDVLSQPMTENEYENVCNYIYSHHLGRDYKVFYDLI